MTQRAQEEDDIENDKSKIVSDKTYIGSLVPADELVATATEEKGQKPKKHRHEKAGKHAKGHKHGHVDDESLVQEKDDYSTERNSFVHPEDDKPLDETRDSHADFNDDQSARKTDTMGTYDKDYENDFYQGAHVTNKLNAPSLNAWHSLKTAWDKWGPTNQPKHL